MSADPRRLPERSADADGRGADLLDAAAEEVIQDAVLGFASDLAEVAGNAALVVDPLNTEELGCAIYQVLESPTFRGELIKKGLRQIRKFSWEKSCQKLLNIYQDLCP